MTHHRQSTARCGWERPFRFLVAIGVAAFLVASQLVMTTGALAEQSGKSDVGKSASGKDGPVVFVPPLRGAPANRIGGATRRLGAARKPLAKRADGEVVVRLLAPEGGGLTASESPTLYWELAQAFKGKLRIVLNADGLERPLIVVDAQIDATPGIRAFSLADHGVTVGLGRIHEWAVTLESEDYPYDRFEVRTYLERVPAEPSVRDALAATAGRGSVQVLAAEGLWFDALAEAVELARSDTRQVLMQTLMKQAGLIE